MRDSDYYPAGAYNDANAPYNEVNTPDIEVTCHVSVNLVKDVPVMTDKYLVENDEEDGSDHIELIASYSDMETEYRKQHRTVPELLSELSKYINGELAGGVTGSRKWELQEMLADCQGWTEEFLEIEEFETAS